MLLEWGSAVLLRTAMCQVADCIYQYASERLC